MSMASLTDPEPTAPTTGAVLPASPPGAPLGEKEARVLCQRLQQGGVRHAKIGGFDIDGVLRGKYVSLEKLESALQHGFGFCDVVFGWDMADALYDRSQVTGWHTGFPDAHGWLDASTERAIPWEPGVVAFLCDFKLPSGEDHAACPRSLLKRLIARAERHGYHAFFGAEFEFFLYEEDRNSLAEKGYRGLKPLDPGMMGYSWLRTGQDSSLMRDILQQLEAFDVVLEGFHTETGPGVYEAAVRYDRTLRAADKAALFKQALKQIVSRHGLSATFMAKPDANLPGASGHLHQSLWRGKANVFTSPQSGEAGDLSPELRGYLGGLCALLPDLTALLSPTVNSYKRFVPGLWAPLTASWGLDNRTCALRVVEAESPKGARIECRQSAADINPYLAMAACLAAGLWGIEQGLEPPPAAQGDAAAVGDLLPRTLEQAVDRFERSEPLQELLGKPFVDHFAMTRRWEVEQYRKAVTDWELRRYFELV